MLGSSLKDPASIRLIRKNQKRKRIQNPQLSQLQNQKVNPKANRGAAAYPPLSLLLALICQQGHSHRLFHHLLQKENSHSQA
jgi:hypothetical protein